MAKLIRLFIILCVFMLATGTSWAEDEQAEASHMITDQANDEFRLWLSVLKEDALRSGISAATIHEALDNQEPDPRVVAFDKKQPEKTITFEEYAGGVVSTAKAKEGQHMREEYEDELTATSKKYGVPVEIIVALWGIESDFGKHLGHFNVVKSLLTLAYEGRRAVFFRNELMEALHVLDEEHISSDQLMGSWAGAMGQCQFMPSTYRHYATDENDDGHRDIWHNEPDVFASIANYLDAEGWGKSVGWGNEVSVEKDIADDEIGLGFERTIDEWRDKGVVIIDESGLQDSGDTEASLIQPDGPGGRSFLVYDNFRALMRWNRSTYFAASVGLLADRIK